MKDKTYASEKNRQIAETYAATKNRRKNQCIVNIDLKVKYGKEYGMPYFQRQFFGNVFIEAKRMNNYLLSLTEKE